MSEPRRMPEPHRYAVCAYEDIPIKEFYKGIFEEVFIFYHPFIKTTTLCYETWKSGSYLGKNNILAHCEPISWAEFLKLASIENVKKLDIGLRTYIGGLNEKFADKATAKTIRDVCEKNRMIIPSEGFFSEFLINKILYAIKKEGHEWIWYGDEFGSERKLQLIDNLISTDEHFGNKRINLFTHDHEILLTTHWDSHFTLLCSDKENVKKIVNACNLEGFYCTDNTKIYWSIFE